MRLIRRAVPILALTFASALTACATAGTGDGYSPDAVTVVQVTNNNASRIVVDAVSLGIDRRLGEVETNSTESFVLPRSILLSDLQLLLDPVGPPGSFLTPRIVADLGDVVQVTVAPNLNSSTYRVM